MGILNTSRLFGGLLTAEVQDLERTAELRQYAAGQEVFREGDPGDGIYVIADGQVRILCQVGAGERRVLSRLGPGDFFGEMAVLDQQTRSATAAAETEVQAHFVRREVLLDALARSPALAVHLVTEFSLRMREFNQQYTNEVVQAERLALVGRFARTIVHDFKNPLNIIGISADMAALEGATPEMRRTARDRVRRQVERMSNMITELLEFTRAGSTPVILGRLELGDYLRPLVEELRMEASPRGVTVVLEGEPAAVRVPLDGRRLAQVFHNLVNNACDAMPAGGEIRLRTRLEPGSVILEVEDTGPGLAPEIASRLFEPFATFGKAHGTGLGLSICRRVVEDHQGEITARNRPGGGAVFTLRLPV